MIKQYTVYVLRHIQFNGTQQTIKIYYVDYHNRDMEKVLLQVLRSWSLEPAYALWKSFPVSGSFPMSQFFASGAQSIGVSASASVLPMNIQD